jgi:hypothetical protein
MIISKVLGAVLVSGVVAAGASAFTAPGLADSAPASQFLGGTVSQTVTGANLVSVTYGFTDATNTVVDSITMVFNGADGKTVSVAPTGNATPGGAFSSGAVNAGTHTYVAAWEPTIEGGPDGYATLTGIGVTVVGDQG